MSVVRRVRPKKTGLKAPLGDLELKVMEPIWAARDEGILSGTIHESLQPKHPVALTTVLTTLDRLYDKGIVGRERIGRSYLYTAKFTKGELEARIVRSVLDDLIAQFPKAVASYFAQDSGNSAEKEALQRLAQKLKRKGR